MSHKQVFFLFKGVFLQCFLCLHILLWFLIVVEHLSNMKWSSCFTINSTGVAPLHFLNPSFHTFAAFCIWMFVSSHCLGKETPSLENQKLFLNISSLLSACKCWNLVNTEEKEQPFKISCNTISTVILTVMVWMKMKLKLGVPCLFMSYQANQAHQLSSFHQSWPKNFWKMILSSLPEHLTNLKLDTTFN